MGRRSDHSRDELHALLLDAGVDQMAQQGLAGFSARAVAKSVGYSVGTIYNVFGGLDEMILAINARTFQAWADHLDAALRRCKPGDDRIAALVKAYFGFAAANTPLWMALYDYRRPGADGARGASSAEREKLIALVDAEVARALKRDVSEPVRRLTRSLIATVHGHCDLALGGSYAAMGGKDPAGQALARVREILAGAK